MRSCATCSFSIKFVDGKNNVLYYECRFNPPTVYGLPVQTKPFLIDVHTVYPHLQEQDWCFQYQRVEGIS